MADAPAPPVPTPEEAKAARIARGRANLLPPCKPGETRNPSGMNGWKRAQARIAKFMRAIANPKVSLTDTRFDRLLLAAYTSAIVPGPKGAMDRKLLIEQVAGKAKQQVEIGGDGGAALRVIAVIPDNGRGPGDPEDPPDGDPSPSAS